jgi:hypothetical protein
MQPVSTALDPTLHSPRVREIKSKLLARTIGQDQAVNKLCGILETFFTGYNDPRRPISVVLELGPTGTGKTRSRHPAGQPKPRAYAGESLHRRLSPGIRRGSRQHLDRFPRPVYCGWSLEPTYGVLRLGLSNLPASKNVAHAWLAAIPLAACSEAPPNRVRDGHRPILLRTFALTRCATAPFNLSSLRTRACSRCATVLSGTPLPRAIGAPSMPLDQVGAFVSFVP